MIKSSLLTFFCLLITLASSIGQTIDYNAIILPDNAKNVGVREKLVQLAWQKNPSNRILENKAEIAQKEIAISKASWLNIIKIAGNLNEYTINPNYGEEVGRQAYYPRYNFSANIPLNIFVTNPKTTQIAKLQYANTIEEINLKKLEVRANVLRRYENYKKAKEIYKIESAMTDEVHSQYIMAEQEFKDGRISYDEWSSSLNAYNSQLLTKIKAQSDLEIAKIDLEQLIGVNIDTLLNQIGE